jgi:hypothetical protein
VLLTRAPLYQGRSPFSHDLHVLSAPLTFVLSQDQTLQLKLSWSFLTRLVTSQPLRLLLLCYFKGWETSFRRTCSHSFGPHHIFYDSVFKDRAELSFLTKLTFRQIWLSFLLPFLAEGGGFYCVPSRLSTSFLQLFSSLRHSGVPLFRGRRFLLRLVQAVNFFLEVSENLVSVFRARLPHLSVGGAFYILPSGLSTSFWKFLKTLFPSSEPGSFLSEGGAFYYHRGRLSTSFCNFFFVATVSFPSRDRVATFATQRTVGQEAF